MSEYLTIPAPERPEYVVLLRHDVDYEPTYSLKVAQVEKAHGLKATYYYRTIPGLLLPEVVKAVSSLGHEIGYHYETLAQAKGDMEQAVRLFATELERLRQYAPVRIASMHGNAFKPWDNRDIWQRVSPQDFGLVGEAYRDFDYTVVQYYSDTGRTWNPDRYNIRDHTGVKPNYVIERTDELIALLRARQLKHVCLLTHPERWQDTLPGWLKWAALDVSANMVKLGIKAVRAR